MSREGIYEYSAGQIGLDGDPNRIVQVYRPDSAVRDPDTIRSFMNVPLIDDHTMMNGVGGKHPEYAAPEEVGIDGVLTGDVWYDENDGWMKGDVKVFTRDMQQKIQERKDDLSLGFGCLFQLTPGEWNGRPYEVVQFKLRGNHLALVEEGRIEGARILDAMCFDSLNFDLPNKESAMPKIIKGTGKDSALEQLKALVPALQAIIEGAKKGELGAQPSSGDELPAEPAPAAAEPVSAAPAMPDENEPPAEPAAEPAAPAAEPAADPSAPVEEPGSAAPAEAGTGLEKPEDIQVLIQQAEALLAQIKDLFAPAPEAPAGDNMEPTPGVAADEGELEAANPTPGSATDNMGVEPSVTPCGDELEGQAEDAALRRFYADNVKKQALYEPLSRVIGAFECAAMDSKSVAAYGVKKLGLRCAKGQEVSTLETYLSGLAKGQKAASEKAVKEAAAMDSRKACSELDAYLKDVK